METVIAVLATFLVFAPMAWMPLVLLLAKGPPQHGSWWYPDPDRWGYGHKLLLYAMLDANLPASDPVGRVFARCIAALVLLGSLAVVVTVVLKDCG